MLAWGTPGRLAQQLEIADYTWYLHDTLHEKLLKCEGSQNAVQSDFVKHSPSFGGSAVDFWYHVGDEFGVLFSQIAKPSSRF